MSLTLFRSLLFAYLGLPGLLCKKTHHQWSWLREDVGGWAVVWRKPCWQPVLVLVQPADAAEFPLRFAFCPPVSEIQSWLGALPAGNSAAPPPALCTGPESRSLVFCAWCFAGGMYCLCYRAGRGSGWPVCLNTITTQSFDTHEHTLLPQPRHTELGQHVDDAT